MNEEVLFCPLDGFLRALCDGWQLTFVVELAGHHGHYAVLLWRVAE